MSSRVSLLVSIFESIDASVKTSSCFVGKNCHHQTLYVSSAALSNAPSLFYLMICRQSAVSWEIYSLDKPDSLHCKLGEQKVASCFMILTITKLVAYTSHQLLG